MTNWPKQVVPIPADDPAICAAELRRHLENPEAVIVLNDDSGLHGVRRLTIGEMWSEMNGGAT